MGEPFNVKVKICLVGDSAVGKTSLIRRYVMDIFDDKYISTLGTKVSKKRLKLKKEDLDIDLTLSIWDVLGQDSFKGIQGMAFKGSRGAMLVCDVTREETLKNITSWADRIKKIAGDIPFVLLANKSDLTSQYKFNESDLESYSSNLNTSFFMTSAKFGDNVLKAFYKLGDLVTTELLNEIMNN